MPENIAFWDQIVFSHVTDAVGGLRLCKMVQL